MMENEFFINKISIILFMEKKYIDLSFLVLEHFFFVLFFLNFSQKKTGHSEYDRKTFQKGFRKIHEIYFIPHMQNNIKSNF